jgi:hypothetical protein
MKPEAKACQGVKNTIFSYNVNKLVNDHNLDLVPIPWEDDIKAPYETGLAAEIRKKFGL